MNTQSFSLDDSSPLQPLFKTAGDVASLGGLALRPINWALDKIDYIPFLPMSFHLITSGTHGLEAGINSAAADMQAGGAPDLDKATNAGLDRGVDYAADMIPLTDIDTKLAGQIKSAVGIRPAGM